MMLLSICIGTCRNDLERLYYYIVLKAVFTTEGFLEVAIECWPGWDLNPRPLHSIQTL